MAFERFKENEDGYAAWLAANPKGYVFNNFGGSDPGDNLLHMARCAARERTEDHGRRTAVEKVCSVSYVEAPGAAHELRGRGGRYECGLCGG